MDVGIVRRVFGNSVMRSKPACRPSPTAVRGCVLIDQCPTLVSGDRSVLRHYGAPMSLPSNRVRHHGSTAPPPSVAPAKNHLGEMDHPRLLCATEQVAPSALPSRFRASGSKGERWK